MRQIIQKELVNRYGDRLLLFTMGVDSNGELLEMEAIYGPHSLKPPLHYHPYQEERFEVLSGKFSVQVDQKEDIYRVGDSFIVPAGSSHTRHNVSDREGRLSWQVRPAMRTAEFFEKMWGEDAAGESKEKSTPNLSQLVVVLREYHQEFRLARPPYFVQRILFSALAQIGRLF